MAASLFPWACHQALPCAFTVHRIRRWSPTLGDLSIRQPQSHKAQRRTEAFFGARPRKSPCVFVFLRVFVIEETNYFSTGTVTGDSTLTVKGEPA
jgi:hypothetical protein